MSPLLVLSQLRTVVLDHDILPDLVQRNFKIELFINECYEELILEIQQEVVVSSNTV